MIADIRRPSRSCALLSLFASWALVPLLLAGCGDDKEYNVKPTIRARFGDEWRVFDKGGSAWLGYSLSLGWDENHFCKGFDPDEKVSGDEHSICMKLYHDTDGLPVGPWSLDIDGTGVPSGFMTVGPGEFTPEGGHSPLITSAWADIGCAADRAFVANQPQRVTGKFVTEVDTPERRKGWIELRATLEDAASVSPCLPDEIVGHLDFDIER
ncbi:hypothetical protein LY474_26700 [Myxococcus stipitatus]|uniref:hypothetical protein n=1 Tax=Myxococcus stipitatus TaxID=83455 RepID=UPI001F1E1FCA|nr:hypothetical protein [Myxococcus stipitatus]MCE9671399.1 hypothetical protein [Myxococcus stipitatus]